MTGGERQEALSPGKLVFYRGSQLGPREIARIQRVVDRGPQASRVEIARDVCRQFSWRRPDGSWAVNSCRLLLHRLERRGWVRLPPARHRAIRVYPGPRPASFLEPLLGPLPGGAHELSGALTVRPIAPEEARGWRAHMARHHYLGSPASVGESLRYAALIGEELVALLSWGPAALHNSPREQYIGWDADTKRRRLPEVVQNTRFLMLPWIRVPHLASRILAANLRRLPLDWQAKFDHSVLLAETFVDVSRFAGTCYRASNWIYLGLTRGFSRRGASYQANGQPKAVFVYPLVRKARERLGSTKQRPEREVTMMVKLDVTKLPLDGKGGLIEVLRQLRDPRKRRGIRHRMVSVMAMAVCATLAGAQTVGAIVQWAHEQRRATLLRLGCLRPKPPSESTFRRILRTLDVVGMETAVGAWLAKQGNFYGQGLAYDGKTLRGSGDKEDKPFHLVSAVLHREGLVVAQTRVPDKTNEINAVRPLFDPLDITGAVVTADAMHAQKKTCTYLVEEKKADYLFVAKDNQPTLKQDIEDLHLEAFPP